MNTKTDPITLFWLNVNKPDKDSCWLWCGTLDDNGYGKFGHLGVDKRSHRMAWTLVNGEIPRGIEVCHKCPGGSNPSCCNPSHLFLGTHRENMEYASKHLEMVHGVNHGHAKLNDESVREMRRLYATGTISYLNIGKLFGVSIYPAWAAINRKSWKHVE